MNQETLEKIRQMRLQGMYNAFKTSMESFKTESMTTDQFVALFPETRVRAQPARKARGIIFRQRIQRLVHHR